MTEKFLQLEMFEDDGSPNLPTSELVRFYSEVGRDIVELGRMLRSPTEERPFIYELRIDLYPASNSSGLAIIKGFGDTGGVIAFQEGSGLLGQLRGLYSRFSAGKIRFKDDEYQAKSYEHRLELYMREREYKAAKLPNR